MDGPAFDRLTRRRFGLLSGGSLAVLAALAARDGAHSRKRRKHKRKRVCQRIGQTCGIDQGEGCCGSLVCDDNTCAGDPICVQDQDGPCNDICDCRLGLQCSERTGTCRQCSLLQTPCQSSEECCLASAGCGLTTGSGTEHVCCQRLGAMCGLDSDCCGDTSKCALSTGVGCNRADPVCCRLQGFPCDGDCDCCDPQRCISGICQ
ncbi:MAG: hypothetical protein U0031_02015 [Thermomicrobiales bacterium]